MGDRHSSRVDLHINIKIMKAVFALLAFTLATANAGNIMDLITEQSVGGKIVEITFDGCDQDYDEECIAERGSTVTGKLRFQPTASAETLKCQLYGYIFGAPIPFPGGCPNTEACNDLDTGDCPIEAGEEFIYNMQMKIESYFPPGPVDGEWNLEAPNEKKFVSFIVPIRIQ